MKTKTVSNKDVPVTEVEKTYIEETFKLFESEEMREHLRKVSVDWYEEDFVEVIFKAPVPLEMKLSLIKKILKQSDYDPENEKIPFGPLVTCRQIHSALKGRYNHPDGTVFRVVYRVNDSYSGWREKFCSTFDEAVEYIKGRKTNAEEKGIPAEEEGFDYDDIYSIEKLLPREYSSKVYLRWILNNNGDVLYFDYPHFDGSMDIEIPGRLPTSNPFKPGDIIIADCRPFAEEKKVLIFDSGSKVPSDYFYSPTCLFINENGNIDAGYFSNNEFLKNPMKTHVSVLYRAKTYSGELTKTEGPLGRVSRAIRKRPKLGQDIYRYLIECRERDKVIPSIFRSIRGVSWELLKKEFGL